MTNVLQNILLAALLSLALVSTAGATCAPVWTEPTTSPNPIIVSGTITMTYVPNCTGWAIARLWIGPPENPISGYPPGLGHSVEIFNEGTAISFTFDTTTLPSGFSYDFAIELDDANGNFLGNVHVNPPPGTDGDQTLGVDNINPTPTPTSTPGTINLNSGGSVTVKCQ